jgi:predicted RNase H-like nuclease (RuvC/YqgF family)
MPFASIDEAWGHVKPYVNYNPIINQTNTNVPEQQPPKQNNMIRVANELPMTTEINSLRQNHEKLETKLDYNLDKMNQELRAEIERLNRKIDSLIRNQSTLFSNSKNTDFFNKNIHDILLFMIFGLFTMLIFDAFFRVIKMKLMK